MLHHHGGASSTRQMCRVSSVSCQVSDVQGFFHLTLLHSTNLHGMLTLACSGQSVPTRKTCRDITSLIKGHNLRPRAHSFALPSKGPQTFFCRTLYASLRKRDLNSIHHLTIYANGHFKFSCLYGL